MISEEEKECCILQIRYLKKYGRDIMGDNYDLLPLSWTLSNNYGVKVEILKDAIANDYYVFQSKRYKEAVTNIEEKNVNSI